MLKTDEPVFVKPKPATRTFFGLDCTPTDGVNTHSFNSTLGEKIETRLLYENMRAIKKGVTAGHAEIIITGLSITKQ